MKMMDIVKNSVLLARMPCGKHKGRKFDEIPPGYLQWLSGTDLDEGMAFTFKHFLGILPQNKKATLLDRPCKGYEDRLTILQALADCDDFPQCRY